MNKFSRTGILFVLSAPSGTGKSTILAGLRQTPSFIFSVSCTTRPARPGEEDGVDYHFISKPEFEERIAQNEFLEYARVHDHFYGTIKSHVVDNLRKGLDVLLDIDVQGARQIRALEDPEIRSALVDVFVMPPTLEELEKRLRKRGTESEEQIAIRLKNAPAEMSVWSEYRYTILSGSMEEDLDKFRALMKAERLVSSRLRMS